MLVCTIKNDTNHAVKYISKIKQIHHASVCHCFRKPLTQLSVWTEKPLAMIAIWVQLFSSHFPVSLKCKQCCRKKNIADTSRLHPIVAIHHKAKCQRAITRPCFTHSEHFMEVLFCYLTLFKMPEVASAVRVAYLIVPSMQ